MLFALVVMAGVLFLAMIVNNRRQPSWWDSRLPARKSSRAADGSVWVYGGAFGGDSGGGCSDAGGGGCDGGGGT
jgi:hypothetical protein